MFKILSRVIYRVLYIINFFTSKFFNKNLLLWLKEFIEEDSYENLKIGNKKISFFVPNNLSLRPLSGLIILIKKNLFFGI